LRERGLPLPAAAVLLCPWVDLDGTTHAAEHAKASAGRGGEG
jgi:acetyl esterase/lipase